MQYARKHTLLVMPNFSSCLDVCFYKQTVITVQTHHTTAHHVLHMTALLVL